MCHDHVTRGQPQHSPLSPQTMDGHRANRPIGDMRGSQDAMIGDRDRRLSRRVAAPLLALTGAVGITLLTREPRTRAASRYQEEPVDPSTTPTAGAAAPPTPISGVSYPSVDPHLIPDDATKSWTAAGPRNIRGVVYHRLFGTLEATDALFHLNDVNQGGLLDYGVDNSTGAIWLWNDPFGLSYPGISPNRAPWANGGITNPTPEAQAFIDDSDIAEAINRDLVSIAIAGQLEDPINDACLEAVAALSAYFAASYADRNGLSSIAYPDLPDKKYGFVWWHSDFASDRACPGPVVMDATPEIVARTREILNNAGLQAATTR